MSVKNSILPIALTTFDVAGLVANFQAINPNGIEHPCIILRINNPSNVGVIISFDGVTDHEFLSTTQDIVINAQTNALPKTNNCSFKKGTIVYVRGVAGIGAVTLSGYYQPVGV
jgi:hypothetical protein